jgi:hypothetical protein
MHANTGARLLFCVWLGLGSVTARAEFEALQAKVNTFTLANGMRFIVLERHQAPVVSCYTYANVGSAQETKGITGLAHLFEHLAFKGSQRIGTRNYAEEVKALETVDQAFAAFTRERQKGAKADAEKLKELRVAFKAAQEEAGKYVVPNECLAENSRFSELTSIALNVFKDFVFEKPSKLMLPQRECSWADSRISQKNRENGCPGPETPLNIQHSSSDTAYSGTSTSAFRDGH